MNKVYEVRNKHCVIIHFKGRPAEKMSCNVCVCCCMVTAYNSAGVKNSCAHVSKVNIHFCLLPAKMCCKRYVKEYVHERVFSMVHLNGDLIMSLWLIKFTNFG